MELQDRAFVVTGGTGVLGTAVVGALLAAGARCRVPYRSDAEAARRRYQRVCRRQAAVATLTLGLAAELAGPNILVNARTLQRRQSEVVAQMRAAIVAAEQTAALQLRDDALDEPFE